MQVATDTEVTQEHPAPLPQVPVGEESAVPADGSVLVEDRPSQAMSPRCAEHARVWTPARREAVESYLAYLQEVLRLRDWTITVDWSKPTGKDALATMTQMTDSRHAMLRLSPEYVATEPRLHGQILLHEVMHCHLFQMESLALATVSALAGKEATAVFDRAYTSANELATDALADALVPLVRQFRLP